MTRPVGPNFVGSGFLASAEAAGVAVAPPRGASVA